MSSDPKPRRWIWIAGAILALAFAVHVIVPHTRATSDAQGSDQGATRPAVPKGTELFTENNHSHVTGRVHYDRLPPTGGAHDPVWLNCGVYDHPVRNENAVHSLEHGTVWITYRPNLPRPAVARLRHFVETNYRKPDRYLILSPYPGLRSRVVASAWGSQLRLKDVGDRRLRVFVARFAGGGQGGEPSGWCTEGTGSPIG
jgi:hypothetical protein